jgi:hypothetical protein
VYSHKGQASSLGPAFDFLVRFLDGASSELGLFLFCALEALLLLFVSSCKTGSKTGGLAANEYSEPLELIGSLFTEHVSSSLLS